MSWGRSFKGTLAAIILAAKQEAPNVKAQLSDPKEHGQVDEAIDHLEHLQEQHRVPLGAECNVEMGGYEGHRTEGGDGTYGGTVVTEGKLSVTVIWKQTEAQPEKPAAEDQADGGGAPAPGA